MATLEDAYKSYLGREADTEGKSYWESQIASGAMTEQQAIDAIRTSPEARTYFTSGAATTGQTTLEAQADNLAFTLDRLNSSGYTAPGYDPATGTYNGQAITPTSVGQMREDNPMSTAPFVYPDGTIGNPPPVTTTATSTGATGTGTTGTGGTTATGSGSAITGSGLGGAVTPGSISRNNQVGSAVQQNLTDPQIPQSGVQTYTDIVAGQDEFVSPTDPRFQVGTGTGVTAAQGSAQAPVTATGTGGTATMDAATVGTGAQGTAATNQNLSPEALAQAAIGDLPPEAMVQSQMEELLAGIESGDIPAWARPAVDAVEGQLAARGLSRSSVGQAALTNAIIQTALPMAQQNAQAITQNFQQDKAAQTQVSLANATASQQLQFQNLSNEQQMAMLNTQQRQQALLSDQSAQNAAAQFNAASENQTRQFMANLQTNVDLNNASRLDAMTQYNVSQQNAIRQFNENVKFQREQFNAQNATAIEQSNLQWRRQINQANTAGINAVNQANAMNAFNLSNQALTFMWQELRDSAKWAFEAAQNDEQRKVALATAAMGNEASVNETNQKYIAALGSAAVNLWNSL